MRLLIVSNRLPITVVEKESQLSFQESAGGLASGLSAYLDSLKKSAGALPEYVWVGWPGQTISEKLMGPLKARVHAEFQAYPVFLSKKETETFYHGFCNKTLWPLFHYFPSYVVYDENYWVQYKQVNERFRDAIMEIIKPDDVVWVHDFHLMLLPKLLREKRPEAPIGFFLHIPFPSFEMFRLLPRQWRTEILEGLLGADLVGFHTHDYTQYFLRCVLRTLGYEHTMGQVMLGERAVKADTFPMGIDFLKFYETAKGPAIEKERDEFRKGLGHATAILSIDRLDYTKGIINRLQGYEAFLQKNPEWHCKVVLVLVVVPSRLGVDHYEQMKRQIDEMVGRINGRFGTIDWTPISYQYRSFSFHPLVALYTVSDVALVTPLRDGMNLIAKEYLASRTDQTGVLILSLMAGAAKELGEAIPINPNHKEEIADALKEALEMPTEEQIRRNLSMQIRLRRYDVIRWADDFIQMLLSLKSEQEKLRARLLSSSWKEQLIAHYRQARSRLLLLDYDGTLVPFVGDPRMAKPTDGLLTLIRRLSEDRKNEIVIISGRDKETLQQWFGMLPVGLVAEHGVWIKEVDQDWRMIKPVTNDWKPQIFPILEMYTDRLPGSFVEEKEFSIVWHYRKADPELGSIRAKELIDNLVNFTAHIDIQVSQGSKVVEVRNAGLNKGTTGMYFISKKHLDFILAAGDDWTDEDLFRVLPENSYSLKVGLAQSYARFNVRDHTDVIALLQELVRNVAIA